MHRVIDFFILGLYVAVVFLLVRPRSQGPALVEKSGNAVIGFVQSVTGGGGFR